MEALSLSEFEQGRYLSPRGPIGLMNRVYKYVLPEVRESLAFWQPGCGRDSRSRAPQASACQH